MNVLKFTLNLNQKKYFQFFEGGRGFKKLNIQT